MEQLKTLNNMIMEKYKTLNNSISKDYMLFLASDNVRACAFLLYNSREMFEKTAYATLVRHFFQRFPFSNVSVVRECLNLFKVDYIVINHIVKLFNEMKGGVYDEK